MVWHAACRLIATHAAIVTDASMVIKVNTLIHTEGMKPIHCRTKMWGGVGLAGQSTNGKDSGFMPYSPNTNGQVVCA